MGIFIINKLLVEHGQGWGGLGGLVGAVKNFDSLHIHAARLKNLPPFFSRRV